MSVLVGGVLFGLEFEECEDCDSFYFGQTGRTFRTQYKEHMGSLRKLQSNDEKMEVTQIDSISAFADHLVENNHSPSLQNPVPLHFAPKSRKLDLLESTEIKKDIINKDSILNNQHDIKNFTLIYLLIDKI